MDVSGEKFALIAIRKGSSFWMKSVKTVWDASSQAL
jgi:hypothetical protein